MNSNGIIEANEIVRLVLPNAIALLVRENHATPSLSLRGLIKALRLPYFARVSVILGAVSSIMVIALLCCEWLKIELLGQMAYFPIVVICLTGEGFARTLTREGFFSALWRGGMTALVAVLVTLMASVRQIERVFVIYPELLLAQVGVIVVMAKYFDLRLLEKLNPPPKKRKKQQRLPGSRTVRPKTESGAAVSPLEATGKTP
jgi:hypothetical protein